MVNDDVWRTPKINIKNLRLTCKLFADLAAPMLLPRLICAPTSSLLDKLRAVSRHPIFSKSIKEIVYVYGRFTAKEIKEHKRLVSQLKSEEQNLSLHIAFSQYIWHYIDQTIMESSGEVIGSLCSAFTRLPNVKKITIIAEYSEFTDKIYLSSHMDSGYWLDPKPDYNNAFLLLARVLSLTGARMPKLVINSEYGPFDGATGAIDDALFAAISAVDLNHCCEAFRSLWKVKITAEVDHANPRVTANLVKMLSGATDLESLKYGGTWSRPLHMACY
jgi:hypothetical protein